MLFDDAPQNFGLAGRSPKMQRVLRTIHKLRKTLAPVLITGESGVGKEVVARAVHAVSALAGAVFLPVNAASLSESLIESELFGHVKGAFTGALSDKPGLVQAANGGTLFLDEIGELNPNVQARLLRLLQEQEVRPVGATKPARVNVRVLAATNRNLRAAIAKGTFREDLFHRLNVVHILVPPLRERKEDIPLLVDFLAAKHAASCSLSKQAMQRFLEYAWPGNVRELENAIRHMAAMGSGPVLHVENMPSNLSNDGDGAAAALSWEAPLPLSEVERRHILEVIEYTQGDLTTAAHILGIGKTTLYRRLKVYSRGRTSSSLATLKKAASA